MIESPDESRPSSLDGGEEAHAGLWPQLTLILRALTRSTISRTLMILLLSIVGVICVTAYGQIRLNRWNKPFYDALSRRDFHDFLYQLAMFFIIAGGLLVLNVAQRWLVETLKVRLREVLVRDLLEHWMMPRRAFFLAHAGSIGVNPDQRMHEDARKLCELSADLGTGLFQASILFVTFAGILWVMSSGFSLHLGEHDYAIPGFMLWAAILYAGAGSLLSYWVGGNLIGRNAQRYAREADLRFSLVRINEHLDGISLAAGEADEKRRAEIDLEDVLKASMRLVRGLTNLTWVTAGFGWITLVAPILVAAPLYFAGKISFGGLMMAASAFTQAQSSLRWFVDNFSTIADWRATLLRVASFRQALTAADGHRQTESRIGYQDGEPGRLTIQNLEIDSPSGRDGIKEGSIEVLAGERVLIAAAPGTGKTLLFRALAGLWPWGSGCIRRPPGETLLYIPRGTPYVPRGTLREVLAYPAATSAFSEGAFAEALARLGLEQLVPMLDVTRRWDRDLSQDEQASLVFARVLLHAPAWVIIEDAFDALDDDMLGRIMDVFARELSRSSVVYIGRAAGARDPMFCRVAHLVRLSGAAPEAAPVAAAPPERSPG